MSHEVLDEQLVERYRAGDDAAFAVLVERYRQELFHFLFRFLLKRASAEDVFQETFLQVHLSLDSFDAARRFKPWLFTIAANKARDHLRRRSQRPMATLSAPVDRHDSDSPRLMDLMQADGPTPAKEIEQREIQDLVTLTMAGLPEHLREILILAYFQKLPYKDVAEALGVPLGTVKSRLHAAVAQFAHAWKTRTGEESP